MRWPIRYQLLAPLLMLLLGIVGITTWTAVASAARARRQLETRLRDIAHTLSEPKFPLQPNVLQLMKGLTGAEYLLLRNTGERTGTLPDLAIDLPPAEAVVDDWQTLRLGPPVDVDGRTYLCSGVRLRLYPDNSVATLYILYPEALWRDALWEAIKPSLVLGGCVGLASVLLAAGVGRRLSRRVGELERRTRLIAAGDFGPMPLPRRHDEIRDLARSVNEMAQQLAQLQQAVRQTERLRLLGQVSGGLAHQLRNGLTGARLALQLHAQECPSREADGAALQAALRQLNLLEVHLKRFLDLGRAGALRRERCSLAALADEAVTLLRPQCRHAGTELRWQRPGEDFATQGDAGQLGQLFVNVLSNAVEAAGPGGWVQVELQIADCRLQKEKSAICNPQSAIVTVTDSGPGPPPDVAARLFEPFVTGKPEGVGLGLAVARQVAEAHGGTIAWHRDPDRTCFRIELPLEPSP
jgi:signal transduction histidine kinase